MRTVPLYGRLAAGRVALVDDEDYALVMQYRWHVWEALRKSGVLGGPYAICSAGCRDNGRRITLRMHKLITGYAQTDHRNHDGLDNQRSNLRPATRSQNGGNSLGFPGHSSQYKGVSWNKKSGKWSARLMRDRTDRYLGMFVSEVDAARAYDAAALEAFGEFACLNFPDVRSMAA